MEVIRVYTLEQAKKLLIRRAKRKIIKGIFQAVNTAWSVFIWLSPILTIMFLITHWILIGY